MKPTIHAENNVKKYGGKIEDYLKIHQFMDSSKGAMCDVRHRALTHTSWFIQPDGILEKVFGVTFVNSDGKTIAVRDIGEDHILEDFDGFIPTPQDFLKDIPVKPWMHRGGGTPNDPVVIPLADAKVDVPYVFPEQPYRDPPPFIPNRWPQPFPHTIEIRDLVQPNVSKIEYMPYCKAEPKSHFICHVSEPMKITGLGVEETAKVKAAIEENLRRNMNMDYSNCIRVDDKHQAIQNVTIPANPDKDTVFPLGSNRPYFSYPEAPSLEEAAVIYGDVGGESQQNYGTIDNPTTLYDPETKEPAVQIWQDENGIGMLDLKLVDKFGEQEETKVDKMNTPFCQKYDGFIFNIGPNVSC